jgi:hypothetical protein
MEFSILRAVTFGSWLSASPSMQVVNAQAGQILGCFQHNEWRSWESLSCFRLGPVVRLSPLCFYLNTAILFTSSTELLTFKWSCATLNNFAGWFCTLQFERTDACAWFQASVAVPKRSSLFWDVRRRRFVVGYRSFGTIIGPFFECQAVRE